MRNGLHESNFPGKSRRAVETKSQLSFDTFKIILSAFHTHTFTVSTIMRERAKTSTADDLAQQQEKGTSSSEGGKSSGAESPLVLKGNGFAGGKAKKMTKKV